MERKAHNTVAEEPAVRCWQHVWKQSDGQKQQLLWEGRVCLIHSFLVLTDSPAPVQRLKPIFTQMMLLQLKLQFITPPGETKCPQINKWYKNRKGTAVVKCLGVIVANLIRHLTVETRTHKDAYSRFNEGGMHVNDLCKCIAHMPGAHTVAQASRVNTGTHRPKYTQILSTLFCTIQMKAKQLFCLFTAVTLYCFIKKTCASLISVV